MWKGSVSFGLVAIPIQLYAATENRSPSFRQVHARDGGRVHYKRVCSVDGEEVPYSEIAKGYDTDSGELVILTDEDLSDLPLPTTKTVDVLEFVPLEAIDPIYFDKSYYLEPQKSAVKAYTLLRDAIHKSGQVAIAKIALRQRESLAVLRVYRDVLILNTMVWPDEVRAPDFAFLREDPPKVRDQELQMAGTLIDSMSDEVFEPEKYTDAYREALEAVVEAKIEGNEVTAPPSETTPEGESDVSSLLAALQASVKSGRSSGRTETDSAEGSGEEDAESDSATGTAPAKKATAKKTPAKKSAADKAAAKKDPGKKTDAKKTPAKKASAKKAPAKNSGSASKKSARKSAG